MSTRPTLALCVATMSNVPYPGEITSFRTLQSSLANGPLPVHVQNNTLEDNLGVVGSYQKLYVDSTEDLLAFVHDDVICKERGWDERVLKEFEDPSVGVVGFGGALRHGDPQLYRVPYRLQQLGRSGYRSNVDDAEVHGERFEGACDVSVLDGFALVVRRELIDRAGGWHRLGAGCDFFCYDYALCAMARRLGYRVRLVGVRCHHLGGRTSVAVKDLPITSQQAYEESHRWFYEEYRDVMPWRCG